MYSLHEKQSIIINHLNLFYLFIYSIWNHFQSPELEYRHELVGRPNKTDTDFKVEIIPRNQQLITNVSSPRLGHSTTTIYDSYGNDCNFSKASVYPDNDSNPYNLLAKYNPSESITGAKHKEYICMSSASEESYMRPPLWEDITSSIQNIDPENAIMLGGAVATHVKLEANDADPYIENLSTAPLLSPELKCDFKPELKSHHGSSQVYVSIPTNSSHHHHQIHANHSVQSSHSIYLNGIISNSLGR